MAHPRRLSFFLFVISNFGYWNLFDIWALMFGISISQRNSNKANPLWAKLFTFLFTWFESLPANQPALFLLLIFLLIPFNTGGQFAVTLLLKP
jgi:hypothetical protein